MLLLPPFVTLCGPGLKAGVKVRGFQGHKCSCSLRGARGGPFGGSRGLQAPEEADFLGTTALAAGS